MKYIHIVCYICEKEGHISIDCKKFKLSYEGNIKRYFEMTEIKEQIISDRLKRH
jgi:hypothetical protein